MAWHHGKMGPPLIGAPRSHFTSGTEEWKLWSVRVLIVLPSSQWTKVGQLIVVRRKVASFRLVINCRTKIWSCNLKIEGTASVKTATLRCGRAFPSTRFVLTLTKHPCICMCAMASCNGIGLNCWPTPFCMYQDEPPRLYSGEIM